MENRAVFVCYEHDPTHLMSRLLCLESADRGNGDGALTAKKLTELAFARANGGGLISSLRKMPRHASILEEIDAYAARLLLVRASGEHGTLSKIRGWVEEASGGSARLVLIVDYLQKVPAEPGAVQSEVERTTLVTHGLKELAISMGIRVIAIAASDRSGLRSRRMRLADLRGGSALQYEADIGIVLNNKRDIVSREHLIYDAKSSEKLRKWLVMSVEKNRAGVNAIDMEYALDAAHFRLVSTGGFVRERLVDQKLVLA